MKLIGVMRICDAFAEHVHVTIPPFSQACDGVCFLTHHVTRPEVRAAIQSCPNLLGTREYSEEAWNHERMMAEAYQYARDFSPDWIAMPDHDELLPYDRVRDEIDAAVHAGKWCVSFEFLNAWESPDRIVAPRLNCTGSHVKVYRGDQTAIVADRKGFCVPVGWWPHIYQSRYPLRHLHMLTATLRARRLRERGCIEPWAKSEPATYPYHADWTVDQWRALK